jgi:hypothetical protein
MSVGVDFASGIWQPSMGMLPRRGSAPPTGGRRASLTIPSILAKAMKKAFFPEGVELRLRSSATGTHWVPFPVRVNARVAHGEGSTTRRPMGIGTARPILGVSLPMRSLAKVVQHGGGHLLRAGARTTLSVKVIQERSFSSSEAMSTVRQRIAPRHRRSMDRGASAGPSSRL